MSPLPSKTTNYSSGSVCDDGNICRVSVILPCTIYATDVRIEETGLFRSSLLADHLHGLPVFVVEVCGNDVCHTLAEHFIVVTVLPENEKQKQVSNVKVATLYSL